MNLITARTFSSGEMSQVLLILCVASAHRYTRSWIACSRAPTLSNWRFSPLEHEVKPLYTTKSKEFHLGSVNTLNKISDKQTSPFKVDNMIRAGRKIILLYNIVMPSWNNRRPWPEIVFLYVKNKKAKLPLA